MLAAVPRQKKRAYSCERRRDRDRQRVFEIEKEANEKRTEDSVDAEGDQRNARQVAPFERYLRKVGRDEARPRGPHAPPGEKKSISYSQAPSCANGRTDEQQ
ncbi:uncharacterized protein LOC113464080 isoform X2 [Ceratina calcarata]|uniref:Uncharacterized protein LOC113464080 isoform X2 n=1 Tax=Ceratina calcarata TaxID=156304 RepID=A0AAJ7RZ96_9HYME|nr:uncharacterized protein LOC113464080 isoform X2 [Ceratina calcarata]